MKTEALEIGRLFTARVNYPPGERTYKKSLYIRDRGRTSKDIVVYDLLNVRSGFSKGRDVGKWYGPDISLTWEDVEYVEVEL